MRRSFVTAVGVLVFMAGLFAAIGMPSRMPSLGSVQAPPLIPGVAPKPSPVWKVQPGQVRVYAWVWWYSTASHRLPGKPVKIFDWQGQKLVGWQSAHSEHWRELRLKPGTRVCVRTFVKNAKTTPSCQIVTKAGQKLVFVVRLVDRDQTTPTPTGPKPPTLPHPPPTTVTTIASPPTTIVVTVTTTTTTATTTMPSTRNLVVRVNGYGRVTSSSSGMDCQGTIHSGSTGSFTVCSVPMNSGSTVTLTAMPSGGNWRVKSGCGSSTTLGASTTCSVVMDTDKTVDVIFEFVPPPEPPG